MSEKMPPPNLSEGEVVALLDRLYGISGTLKPLVSYDDQNFRVSSAGGRYVLKISNGSDDPNFLAFQNALLQHMETSAPHVNLPRVVFTKTGAAMGDVVVGKTRHVVRLLTYLEGIVFAEAEKSIGLYENLGRFMGNFSAAMAGFSTDIVFTPNQEWNLDEVLGVRNKVHAIKDPENHRLIVGLLEQHESKTVPKLADMRTGFLHQDANEFNLLVAADNPQEIAGLIDFGDALKGRQINELAITIAYAMLTDDAIIDVATAIVRGYVEAFPITEQEASVVMNLAAMRLVASITLGSHRALDYPDNSYITISQKPSYRVLKALDALDTDAVQQQILQAAGF